MKCDYAVCISARAVFVGVMLTLTRRLAGGFLQAPVLTMRKINYHLSGLEELTIARLPLGLVPRNDDEAVCKLTRCLQVSRDCL